MKRKRKETVSESDDPDDPSPITNIKKSPTKDPSVKKGQKNKSQNIETVNIGQSNEEEEPSANDTDNNIEEVNEETDQSVRKKSHNESSNGSPQINRNKATFTVEELTSDDEVYTIQYPKSFTKEDLCKIKIDFSKRNQKINTQTKKEIKLELFNSDKKFITMAVPSEKKNGCLINVPLKGHILMKETVNFPNVDYGEEIDTSVKFPDDIKVRHPLLGADWEAYLELADKAIRKKRRKDKKHKSDLVESEVSPSKKKKIKIKLEND